MSSEKNTDTESKTWNLDSEYELRIEAGETNAVTVKLLEGSAELFGAVLTAGHEYKFSHRTIAIFTWRGCQLQVTGRPNHIYTANETPMISYINAHAALNKLREEADRKGFRGPRTMIVGPTDSGKSSLCRILLNYAIRANWKPVLVDIDVGQNCISIPGSIAASAIEHPITPDQPGVHYKAPLVYYYGHNTPRTSTELYTKLMDQLSEGVDKRIDSNDEKVQASGVIINTCGWVRDKGYELLIKAAAAFSVDVVLVLGEERLYSQLREDKKLERVTVAKLSKSGGVFLREQTFRHAQRKALIKEYFYGSPSKPLFPTSTEFSFTDLKIYKFREGTALPASALPLGATQLIDPNAPTLVRPSNELKHKVLAVTYAKREADLFTQNVAGFAYVQDVDDTTQTLTLLVPCADYFPSNYVLVGSVSWFD